MTLFQTGEFTLSSGDQSKWKIECDQLSGELVHISLYGI